MSVSYSANVIIGVPADQVINVEKKKVNVTKYHPDTGQPYITQIYQYTTNIFGEVFSDHLDREEIRQKVENKNLEYIELGTEDTFYVGKTLLYASDYDQPEQKPFEDLQQTYNEVKSNLEKCGCVGQIYIVNSLNCSY